MTALDTPDRPDKTDWTYGAELNQPLDTSDPAGGVLTRSAEPATAPAVEGRSSAEADAGVASGNRDRAQSVSRTDHDLIELRQPGDGDSKGEPEEERGKGQHGKPAPDAGQRDDRQAGGNNQGAEKKDEPPPPPPSKWVFVGVAVVLLALLGWGGYAHWRRSHEASATQKNTQDRVTEVRTAEAKKDDKPVDLTLPGQTEAFATASLYARATGYISERHVDIGSRVKKGDLMLHIAAPDLDQQLAQAIAQVGQVKAAEAQAQAQVNQAQANLNLAKVTLARTATLTQQGYETLQNRDNQQANLQAQQASLETANAAVKVAEANTKAQIATVDRLKALTGFEDVIAPFDGIVTVRNVDVGDLVNADSATASPLFSVARDDVLRVSVQVPQNNAVGVEDGLPARVEVPQLPGQPFTGTVTRSSVALLSSARTLDTEVDIPNPDGRLRPGLFAYVTISVPRDHPDVIVPAEAMIFNQHGLQVATVEDNKAKLHAIKVGRDFGTTLAVTEGLKGGEQVILSPPAILQDGTTVKPQPAKDQRPEGGDQPDQKKPDNDPDAQNKQSKPDTADKSG